MSEDSRLAQVLRIYMVDKQIDSARDLADRAKIAHTTVNRILAGAIPSASTLKLIAAAMDIDASILLEAAGYIESAPSLRAEASSLFERLYAQLAPEDQEEIRAMIELKLARKRARAE